MVRQGTAPHRNGRFFLFPHRLIAPIVIARFSPGRHIGDMRKPQKLTDLVSVGLATAADFEQLGITRPEQLRGLDARELFEQLQRIKGHRLDPCCEDVFRAAIAQVDDPDLPQEQRQWPYWSKVRKRERA